VVGDTESFGRYADAVYSRRPSLGRRALLTTFDDQLPVPYSVGVRAIVSLIEKPTDAGVCETAGFTFPSLPIQDRGVPTLAQAEAFVHFVSEQCRTSRPIAVYCKMGLGRTGTMLAIYLISKGESPDEAIEHIRGVERFAIQTELQVRFLKEYAEQLKARNG
jgi:atypical dual specificity phosphatase